MMVQGLGMLRESLGNNLRLHIWNPELEYPNVSKTHNHSWDLSSYVVCGEIRNQRFIEAEEGEPHWKRRLVCGVGCHWRGEPVEVRLKALPIEIIKPGEVYCQKANEIHTTSALPGTTTLMKRTYDGPSGEADIFWPVGAEWGTAELRQATQEEIDKTVNLMIGLLFNG